MPLQLRGQTFTGPVVMAIINRTPDSFFDRGATFELERALAAVDAVVTDGAQIVDIGGVKAGPGAEVGIAEEIRRTEGVVGAVRERYPELVISVDTWRAEVGRAVAAAGADLLNDAWGGYDPQVAQVAADAGIGLVCTHAGRLPPRTKPHRSAYADVTGDVVAYVSELAERAAGLGVPRDAILIDPGHDFGKNTRHSLTVTRELPRLVETGWPVLVALSRKDFVGETLNLPVQERLEGTLAATAVSAWLGAQVFRAHDVRATRRVLDMVATIHGDREPAISVRGLA